MVHSILEARSTYREVNFRWVIENFMQLYNSHVPIQTHIKLDEIAGGFYINYSRQNIIMIESDDDRNLSCWIDLYIKDRDNEKIFPVGKTETAEGKVIRQYRLSGDNFPINRKGEVKLYFYIKYLATTVTTLKLKTAASATSSAPSAPAMKDLEEELPSKDSIRRNMSGMENLKEMFEKQELCDMKFKIRDDEIKASTVVLAVASPYFEAMFKHENTIESIEHLVDLSEDSDVTLENFRAFLDYLYGCKSVSELGDLACELLVLSDKFDVRELKEACELYLGSKLSGDNVARILIYADKCNCSMLKERALAFAKANKDAVKSSSGFDELCRYPNIIVDLLW